MKVREVDYHGDLLSDRSQGIKQVNLGINRC